MRAAHHLQPDPVDLALLVTVQRAHICRQVPEDVDAQETGRDVEIRGRP